MKRTRYLTVVFAALLPVMVLSVATGGCKKPDDDPPPAPTVAAPAPTPAPTVVTVTPEEDAGLDAAADADAAKPTGPGGAFGTISKCCAALSQNANSAPLDQKAGYMAAAAACQGMKNTPVAQQAFGQLRAFLMGAKMPGACQ